MTATSPEDRAIRVCVIARAVGKGLPRNHSKTCGHCGKVAGEIRRAVIAETERCAEIVEGSENALVADVAAAIRREDP